jgi:hypothetical protein
MQNRHHRVHEAEFALRGQRRGLARVIVAGDGENPSVARGAGVVRVLEGIAGPVDARTLAVPHAEDPVVAGAGEQVQLLRAPDGGRRQVLVDPRLEADVVLLEERAGLPQSLVEPRQRRAAVAGDESRRFQPRRRVALLLHHRQADERLNAGQEDAAGRDRVLVVEGEHGVTEFPLPQVGVGEGPSHVLSELQAAAAPVACVVHRPGRTTSIEVAAARLRATLTPVK